MSKGKGRGYTLRIPAGWAGRLESRQVSAWLAAYLRRPFRLQPDPGAGEAEVCLYLPRRGVNILAAAVDAKPSAALRSLILAHLGAPAAAAIAPPSVLPVPAAIAPAAMIHGPAQFQERPETAAARAEYWRAQRGGLIPAPAKTAPVERPAADLTGARKMQSACFFILAAGGVWAVLFGGGAAPASSTSTAAAPVSGGMEFKPW